MPHRGKKKFKNKEKRELQFSKKKIKKRKLKSALKSGELIIKNLSFKATENNLKEYLKQYGNITEVKLLQKADGNPIGRGVVRFSENQNAVKAVQNCNGKDFMGRKIIVDWAVPRPQSENDTSKLSEMKEEDESDGETSHKTKTEEKTGIMKVTETQSDHTKKQKKAKSKNSRRGRLIVRNLPFKVTEETLRAHFEKYGAISEVKLLRRPDGKLVGCGFIQFVKRNKAAKAISNCSGKPLLGRTIVVDWAVPKSTFSAKNEASNIEGEIKKEEDDDGDGDDVKISKSFDDNKQPIEIKEEPLSDEEKVNINTRSGKHSVSNDDSDEDINSDDEDDGDVEDREESDDESEVSEIRKPRVVSNDVSEGRTVFIKNVPFSANNEDLKACMEQYGQVVYALVCIDPVTEHSKGTAFVKFQKKESADECLSAGTELKLKDQILDVYKALNKDDLKKKADFKHEERKNKDTRHLYLVKEGVILARSKAAAGVSMADMAKRLQLEQWKTQMLRNLNMFVSRYRLVVHNLPSSWNDVKLRRLFLKHAGPTAVIREARVMRDMRNIDAQGVGKSKEFGFVSFTNHEHALQALRNINNNPDIFSPAKRPIVAFSIENKAIMNVKQKRLEKSRAKNPFYSAPETKAKNQLKSSSNNDNAAQHSQDHSIASNEDQEAFLGVTSKPGSKKLRTRFGLKSEAKLHNKIVRKDKHSKKMKHKYDQQVKNRKERLKGAQTKKGVKRKNEEVDTFSNLVGQYKSKLMSAPSKKWYDE